MGLIVMCILILFHHSIFWDPRLQPMTKNYPAMDYKADEPLTVDSVTISHVQKFFVNYINNDNLGQIANAHLATADRSPRGAMDGACLRLAQLHSLAVGKCLMRSIGCHSSYISTFC
jgi:hypothetical protein